MPHTRRIKKQTDADLKREWGLLPTQTLRYKGIAGVYWHYLSLQVRHEDFEKYGGKCVSCPVRLETPHHGDCGHLVASGSSGFATRFLRQNLALQCKPCNNPKWRPDAPAFYALEVEKRWGKGTLMKLLCLKGTIQKEMTKEQYAEAIKALPSYQNR